VWSMLRGHFELAPDAEITLEANPESVRPTLLEAWADGGVNRLSMGAQSFDRAGAHTARPHPRRGAAGARDAPRAGARVRRLSLDLMFGFPAIVRTRSAARSRRRSRSIRSICPRTASFPSPRRRWAARCSKARSRCPSPTSRRSSTTS
jgi:oxygen-independent coproporphyrinogen-3 oxidase